MTEAGTQWKRLWRAAWTATFYLTALSPVLLWLMCCGGCALWLVGACGEIRDGSRKLSVLHDEQESQANAMRAAEQTRQSVLRTAAIDAAKRTLAERGISEVADQVSVEQDFTDKTSWTVKGQVLISEHLRPFTVVLQYATFNNVDHWDVKSVQTGSGEPSDVVGRSSVGTKVQTKEAAASPEDGGSNEVRAPKSDQAH